MLSSEASLEFILGKVEELGQGSRPHERAALEILVEHQREQERRTEYHHETEEHEPRDLQERSVKHRIGQHVVKVGESHEPDATELLDGVAQECEP